MGLVLIVFIAAFLLTSSVGALVFHRQTALRRLTQMVSPPDAALLRSITPAQGSKIAKLTKPFQNVVPRTKDDVLTLQKRLHRAGYREPSAVNIVFGSKVLIPVTLCLIAFITQIYRYNP